MVLCAPYTLFLHKNYYSGKFAFTRMLQYNMTVKSDKATAQGASPSVAQAKALSLRHDNIVRSLKTI